MARRITNCFLWILAAVLAAICLFLWKWPALAGRDCLWEGSATWCDDGETGNGYWWNGWWVPEMPTDEHWQEPAPAYSSGRLVWYAPGPMRATANYRGLSLKGYLGGVAMMSPADIGKDVWINRGYGWEGPFLVVDCAQYDDVWPIVRYRREVIEVDWETKERWGLDAPIEVLVAKGSRPGLTQAFFDFRPIEYPEWWLGL